MSIRVGAVAASAVVVGAVALVLGFSNGSSTRPAPRAHAASLVARFGGARVGCSSRSEANFPGAFTDPRNLVVGPLALMGGTYTDPTTVRRFGGNKFPLLVKAGHTVTVRVPGRARGLAGLAYGRLPQRRQTTLRDTYQTVTFVACRPGGVPRHYSAKGPSASRADGAALTFWSGGIVTRQPACVPLEVYLDGAPAPRRVGLALGRHCAP